MAVENQKANLVALTCLLWQFYGEEDRRRTSKAQILGSTNISEESSKSEELGTYHTNFVTNFFQRF